VGIYFFQQYANSEPGPCPFMWLYSLARLRAKATRDLSRTRDISMHRRRSFALISASVIFGLSSAYRKIPDVVGDARFHPGGHAGRTGDLDNQSS
jgi:hypothetical protein